MNVQKLIRRLGTLPSFNGSPNQPSLTILQMKSSLRIVSFFLTLAIASFAGEIRKGAAVQVKANSIWFQDSAALTKWQQLKISGNSKGLNAYEEKMLSNRDAWQFLTQLNVKVISYDSAKNQVNVEMTTPGRMLGTKWFLDAGTLVK
jgi:hypothetical protein